MAWRVQYFQGEGSPAKCVTVLHKVFRGHDGGCRYAHQGRLGRHVLVKRQVIPVHEHRGARGPLESLQTADVVDVRVSGNDVLGLQVMAGEHRLHALDFVPGVNNHRFAARLVPNNLAVALQQAYAKNLVNHRALPLLVLLVSLKASFQCNRIALYHGQGSGGDGWDRESACGHPGPTWAGP